MGKFHPVGSVRLVHCLYCPRVAAGLGFPTREGEPEVKKENDDNQFKSIRTLVKSPCHFLFIFSSIEILTWISRFDKSNCFDFGVVLISIRDGRTNPSDCFISFPNLPLDLARRLLVVSCSHCTQPLSLNGLFANHGSSFRCYRAA